MNARTSFLFVTAAALLSATGGVALRGQSLADVAREEEARRKDIKQPSKVYTNKDLVAVPPPSAPPPAAAAAPAAPADKDKDAGSGAAKDGKAGEGAGAAASTDKPRDQAYWSGRMKALLTQLDQDELFLQALQSRINALTADFSSRDDPAQRGVIGRDRQKAVEELDRVQKRVVATRKAIADLQEEARRASVPPGWLR